MTARDIVTKTPNPVLVICGTAIVIAVLGAYVFLANTGKDAAEISRFVNTALNFVLVILTAGGFISAAAANKNANEARESAEKTGDTINGELDAKIAEAMKLALSRQEETNEENRRNPSN
jgi:hypothetical protein